jgi:hypothetical protein
MEEPQKKKVKIHSCYEGSFDLGIEEEDFIEISEFENLEDIFDDEWEGKI